MWKGEKAGKKAKHEWISVNYGKPNYCEHCKRTDRKKYEWANIDHKYRRVIEDFIRLCVSCHRKYDYEYNGRKTRWGVGKGERVRTKNQ
jgi:hypothetical protein